MGASQGLHGFDEPIEIDWAPRRVRRLRRRGVHARPMLRRGRPEWWFTFHPGAGEPRATYRSPAVRHTAPKAPKPERRRPNRQPRYAMGVLGVVGVGAVVATTGTYASFTSSTAESQSFASGTVTIAFPGAAGAATNRLTIAASGLVPGDTVQRVVDIANTGSQDFASIVLTTSATTTSLLDTDATNGLQIVIDRCSATWTEAGSNPAFTYTCGGSTASVLATRAVIGSNLSLSNLAAVTSGQTDHLRVTMTLPSTAGNTFQGLTSVVQYSFTATQRAGSAH